MENGDYSDVMDLNKIVHSIDWGLGGMRSCKMSHDLCINIPVPGRP